MNYTEILLAIAPVFLLIAFGYGLRRSGFPGPDFWKSSDKFVYWVLFPALLFSNASTADLSGGTVFSFAIVIYSGFGSAVLFALITGRLFHLKGPIASSLLQGAARHNTFIALAAAERLLGDTGLSTAVLFSALLIPVTNITVVTLMTILIQGETQTGVVRAISRDLARNPLLLAIIIGISANLLGITPIPVVNEMTAILGRAALPIMLIGVGASIKIRQMGSVGGPALLSVIGKMAVFPLVVAIAAQAVGLPEMARFVAIIFGAVPTAASAYTLARQMGGDAEAMSAIITIQTAASFFTLPLTLAIAQLL